jgi:hypothetical protein
MKFRTEILLPPASPSLSHSDGVMLLGSCFVEHLAARLQNAGFVTSLNPFGVLYNPDSIARSLRDILQERVFTADDLFTHEGLLHSFAHHSRFSGTHPAEVLHLINTTLRDASDSLRQAKYLIITFGTSNVFRLERSGEVVSNCHKLPAQLFREEKLSIRHIVESWTPLIKELLSFNPQLRILFTVSPIRHLKEGAHGNQLSKATLLLATEELVQSCPQCSYFPSYELLLDDLRDYRFYADDLTHPNKQAIDYIWEKFGDVYFNQQTAAAVQEEERKRKALNHRPLH